MAKAKKKSAKKAAPAKKTAKKVVKKAAKKPVTQKKAAKKASAPKATVKKTNATPANAKSHLRWDEFLTPLDDRIIVEIASEERMTAGGLYIPDTASDTSGNFKGRVLIVGRGHRDEKGRLRPMDVKTGDLVLFSEYSGSKINLMGKDLRIIRESEVLGIIDRK